MQKGTSISPNNIFKDLLIISCANKDESIVPGSIEAVNPVAPMRSDGAYVPIFSYLPSSVRHEEVNAVIVCADS
jgi:hypothetical protein